MSERLYTAQIKGLLNATERQQLHANIASAVSSKFAGFKVEVESFAGMTYGPTGKKAGRSIENEIVGKSLCALDRLPPSAQHPPIENLILSDGTMVVLVGRENEATLIKRLVGVRQVGRTNAKRVDAELDSSEITAAEATCNTSDSTEINGTVPPIIIGPEMTIQRAMVRLDGNGYDIIGLKPEPESERAIGINIQGITMAALVDLVQKIALIKLSPGARIETTA